MVSVKFKKIYLARAANPPSLPRAEGIFRTRDFCANTRKGLGKSRQVGHLSWIPFDDFKKSTSFLLTPTEPLQKVGVDRANNPRLEDLGLAVIW